MGTRVRHATPIIRATGYEQAMRHRAGMVGLDGYSAPGCADTVVIACQNTVQLNKDFCGRQVEYFEPWAMSNIAR